MGDNRGERGQKSQKMGDIIYGPLQREILNNKIVQLQQQHILLHSFEP